MARTVDARALACALASSFCLSCQPPWAIDGTIVGETVSAAATAVVHKAISYATVSFRCPSGTPKPQTMATTNGTFAFRGDGTSFPVSCEIDVVASGYVRLTRDFTTACDQTAGPDRCRRTLLAIELVPLGKAISAPPSPSTPAPAPTPSGRDPGYLF